MVTSGRCPEQIQGSFEMITSPDSRVFEGNISRNVFSEAGRVPINYGLLWVDWASDRPFASRSTQAKSFDSLSVVEKEARTSAADASSTMATSRFHKISRLLGSNVSDLGAPFCMFMRV